MSTNGLLPRTPTTHTAHLAHLPLRRLAFSRVLSKKNRSTSCGATELPLHGNPEPKFTNCPANGPANGSLRYNKFYQSPWTGSCFCSFPGFDVSAYSVYSWIVPATDRPRVLRGCRLRAFSVPPYKNAYTVSTRPAAHTTAARGGRGGAWEFAAGRQGATRRELQAGHSTIPAALSGSSSGARS